MFSGNTLGQMIGLISIPIITRIYTPELYGQYNIYIQLIVAISILISFRYEHLLMLSSTHETATNNLKNIIILALLASLILLVFTVINENLVEKYYVVDLDLYLILILISAGFFTCISYGLEQNLQKKKIFFRSTFGDIIHKVVFFICALICAYSGMKEYGLLLSLMLGLFTKTIYLLWLSSFDIFINKIQFDFKELKGFSKRSFALVYSHLLLVSTVLLPLSYIASSFGENTLGQFSLSLTTLGLVVLLGSQPMAKVYFQRMSKTKSKKERLCLWNKTFKLSVVVSLPIFLVIYFTSDWAYLFIFGGEWMEAGAIAKVIMFSSFFVFISRPMESTSLVLNIWWYSPIWHTFRALSVYFFIEYSKHNDIQLDGFLQYYVYLLITIYLIDIVFQRALLKRSNE